MGVIEGHSWLLDGLGDRDDDLVIGASGHLRPEVADAAHVGLSLGTVVV